MSYLPLFPPHGFAAANPVTCTVSTGGAVSDAAPVSGSALIPTGNCVSPAPWEVQELLDGEHPEFVRRARRMQDASFMAMKAVNAKDPNGLLLALEGIDKACESCHLHYWYPKDLRARQAAKEDGVLE